MKASEVPTLIKIVSHLQAYACSPEHDSKSVWAGVCDWGAFHARPRTHAHAHTR